MSTIRKLTAGLALTAAAVTALAFSPAAEALRSPADTTSAAATLSTNQLVAMYEEERLSGDVYDAFADQYGADQYGADQYGADQYGAGIFTSIGRAEDMHQSHVAWLLESRGYDLGTLPTQPGDYTTDGYDELYDDLVAQGSAGIDSAYEVGVIIETRDIADLERLLAATTDEDEIRVLTALRNGSLHHLAAFSGGEQGTYGGMGGGMYGGMGGGMYGGMGPGMGPMGGGRGAQNGPGVCDGTGPNLA